MSDDGAGEDEELSSSPKIAPRMPKQTNNVKQAHIIAIILFVFFGFAQ